MARGAGPVVQRADVLGDAWAFGVDAQKKSCLYRERHEEERHLFEKELEGVPVAARVYVDEAGVDDTLNYAYGWSRRGTGAAGEHVASVSGWGTAPSASRWRRLGVPEKSWRL